MADLDRFVAAQAPAFDRVVAELMRGTKQSHWMWFIAPQLRALGSLVAMLGGVPPQSDQSRQR